VFHDFSTGVALLSHVEHLDKLLVSSLELDFEEKAISFSETQR